MSVLNRGGEERELPMLFTSPIQMREGDLFRHVMAGGGGFGPPESRDPEAVLRDVEDGLLTMQAAERDYGVVLAGTPLEVNLEATAKARRARA